IAQRIDEAGAIVGARVRGVAVAAAGAGRAHRAADAVGAAGRADLAVHEHAVGAGLRGQPGAAHRALDTAGAGVDVVAVARTRATRDDRSNPDEPFAHGQLCVTARSHRAFAVAPFASRRAPWHVVASDWRGRASRADRSRDISSPCARRWLSRSPVIVPLRGPARFWRSSWSQHVLRRPAMTAPM